MSENAGKELRECPFCGGAVEMHYTGSSDWEVVCKGCPVETRFWVSAQKHGYGAGENAEAVKRWNTRTPSPIAKAAEVVATMVSGEGLRGVWFSQEDCERIEALPPGTKLYLHPLAAPAPSTPPESVSVPDDMVMVKIPKAWFDYANAFNETVDDVMRRALINIASANILDTASNKEIATTALRAAGVLAASRKAT